MLLLEIGYNVITGKSRTISKTADIAISSIFSTIDNLYCWLRKWKDKL